MPQLSKYLQQVQKEFAVGNATEHTHRPALKNLIESFGEAITATNEPKRQTFGAPDYIIRKREIPLGYIEAKDVGKNLDKLSKSDTEQLNRYLEALSNLVLTNYLEFRWYVRGKLRMAGKLAEIDKSGKIRITSEGEKETTELINAFLTEQVETVASPQELAKRMAAIAQLIRGTIKKALKEENKGTEYTLHEQLESFRQTLLPHLTDEEFADLYAQTIAYGLFTARCHHAKSNFTRKEAAHYLPKTNPFLRETFDRIAGINLDERIAWAVDDLAELLNRAKMSEILQDFGKRTRQEDPVVHFYETFLKAYDPKLRETRGVYYTPEPVVSYIVRSVEKILQEEFGLPRGLADSSKIKTTSVNSETENETHKVLILDPATGTGTFLYSVIKNIFARFEKNQGMWDGYVSEHLLPRLFGFEFLVAPYAVAHLKLGLLLEETGYKFQSNERLRIYLTNTLEEPHSLKEVDPTSLTRYINTEASYAKEVKIDKPVMVILGNPPYEVASKNKNEWIDNLIEDYKKDLAEKKLNLDDDFIKFIRFSQWRIEQTGYGILAFITNHTYIDGITHRRMRESLMTTFDDIYILDLHGSSKKKERSPDGSKDENVFDIQQGVAISIFVKKQNGRNQKRIFHSELWGNRKYKYEQLSSKDVSTTKWKRLEDVERESCLGKFFFFAPKGFNNIDEYCRGWSVKNIFITSGAGVKTERDRLTVHLAENEIREVVNDFAELSASELKAKYDLEADSRDWSLKNAKSDVITNLKRNCFREILYRPFDSRHTWYSGQTRGFIGTPAFPTMRHLLSGSIALACLRQSRREEEGAFFVGKGLIGKDIVSIFDIATIFPLYLYPTEKKSLFDDFSEERQPNLSPKFIADFSNRLNLKFIIDGKGDLKKTFGSEDVFAYAYAIFYSSTYRTRYSEFLKIDFPRLPLTSNTKFFHHLIKLGTELINLHLMEKSVETSVTFPEKGNNVVEFVKYMDEEVWINKKQYFGKINQDVWDFHIGSYQVCPKWLKDRKGRKLNYDDLSHYQRIVSSLTETIKIMANIDDLIEAHGGFPFK